jgi:hypothetical protein
VPFLKRGRVELKLGQHRGAFAVIPSVRQQYSAHIEENYVEGEHRRLSLVASTTVALHELDELG